MITRRALDRLASRPPTPESPVLTVYLDVDQSHAANLNREFEVVLRTQLRAVEQRLPGGDRRAFRLDAVPVALFVVDYVPRARTLVVVSDSAGLFWTGQLQARVPTSVHFGDTPYLRPLLEVVDEQECYGVIVADKERARVFTVFLGEIEEERDAYAAGEVRHKKSSGTDHLRSQMNFQREDDMHVLHHLRRVAALADELARRHAFDRLLLAGPVVATSTLRRLLPKGLLARVVGTLRLPTEASAEEILRATLAREADVERAEERVRVEALLTAAGKRNGGVVGLEPTLGAVQAGRVWRLVYAAGWNAAGAECPRCGALFPVGRDACDYCDTPLHRLEDIVARAAARVADAGGAIECVAGDAARRLRDAGSIGGLLRF